MRSDIYLVVKACSYECCQISPGKVRHTRLATSNVMHKNAISRTIWEEIF